MCLIPTRNPGLQGTAVPTISCVAAGRNEQSARRSAALRRCAAQRGEPQRQFQSGGQCHLPGASNVYLGWLDRGMHGLPACASCEPRAASGAHACLGARVDEENVSARSQANAYLATTFAGDVMAHLSENFSRDYFIQGIKQITEGLAVAVDLSTPEPGAGPAPASKGGYIVSFPGEAGGAGAPVSASGWLVP